MTRGRAGRARPVWLAAAVVLGLATARVARPALGPRYGGELRVALADPPATLDPAVPHSLTQRLLSRLVHATLVDVDEEGRPRPALAQAWATAAEGREWTLRMAPASFHDGAPVSAADALRALRRFLRSDSVAAGRLSRGLDGGEAFRRGTTDALPGLGAPDENRLVLRFRRAGALPLAPLSSPAAAVVSARGSGAGPFAPTTPLSPRGLSATAFGGHVAGRPFLDVVRLAVVPALAAEGGLRADVTAGAPGLGPAGGLLLLLLDPAAAPFYDPRARRLAAATVDRGELRRHFLSGGEPAEVLLAPWLLPPAPKPSAGGPDRSDPTALRGRLVLRVASDVPPSASQRIVAHLAALGLDVQASPAPAAAALGATGQARLVVWYPEVAEAGLALEELAELAGSPAEVHAVLDAADAERDADRRRADLLRAEEALRDAHVLVPLARVPLALSARPGVHGLRVTASGTLAAEDAWIEP